LSKPFEGDITEYVLGKLTAESKALFEFLPKSISSQLLLDRDPHGNVQVSKIDTERLLILLVRPELEKRAAAGTYKGSFYPQAHFFGYEGRCALPSTFDSQYCYSLGLNAAVLLLQGLTGYMSCVKGVGDRDPTKWVAAGCPLPTMMNIERRKGKDVPVIKKALVELDQDMFKAFEAVREKWALLDCYRSPGPIQF
jgi:diphosphate--fructose-6-phosphate 1-phosphotransferase